ncbi:protein starmaker-like [Amphiprion ocellaris]|uniref:protein starmaker-like n=1 Tax=Amphiprion ocellaris TaxID=80972 RepID=UPI0024113CA3|nr:protein starmaker-like [Amphiprion ocellaris]
MAAPKENLLSLGHLTSTEQSTFTKQREHYAMKSVNRPMLAQTDFSTLQSQQHLKKMHLQQRWQELKERECAAQQHNRQLLLQFEKAQETLEEMLVRNAAMKTIRVEYERYLVESSPRWQQQLEEKTQTAQKKCLQQRMEDCLRSYQKITEDEPVTKSSADQPLLSQGAIKRPQKIAAPQTYSSQEYSNYNQDGFSHLPYTQSSPLTHSQSHTGRFPIRVPFQPHTSSQVPPSFLQHSHPFPLHHLTPPPGRRHHHHPWLRQDPPGWASQQPDYPWSWTAGAAGIPSGPEALWGQIYMEEPPPESRVSQTVREEKTSRAPSSKAERGGGSRSSHLSQELDVKPVRLSIGQAESSESGRDSTLASRETRKRREKRGRTRHSSSDRERCSSQESSRTSSAIVIASAAVAESSESDASPEKDCNSNSSRRTRRSGGFTVGSPRSEKMAKGRTNSKGDDSESQHTGEELGSSNDESKRENLGNQCPDDTSESCKEESGSQRDEESRSESVKIENGDENEKERSSSEESSTEEKDKGERKKVLVAGEDDGDAENSQRDEQREDRNMEGDDEQVCARNNSTEEEEAAEEEMEDQGCDEESNSLKKKDGENIKQDSASSSQDEEEEEEEDESEGSEDKIEEDKEESDEEEDEDGSEGIEDSVGEDEEGSNKEDGESEDEEEHRRDEEGKPEERDSDDSIICPQQKRSIQVQVIPEEAAEDDEGDEEEEEEKSKTGSSNDDSNEFSDEDIEDLLAPQQQTKEEKDPKAEEKPKAFPDSMKIFQVERDTSKTNHPNNSDEFDDFYD